MGWLLKGAAGAGLVALGANVALVLSAIPAVAGKGAPYMPTLQRALHATFDKELPKLLPLVGRAAPVVGKGPLPGVPHVVDLGSGDGRVVLAAARRGYRASGFEINPMLVGFSQVWAAIDRRRWPASGSASFACRDLWTLDLSDADVVFVYGLSPIMKRLSTKLLEEAPTAIIVSNVFELDPSKWRKLASSQEAHFYVARAAAPTPGAQSQSETAPQAPAATTAAVPRAL